MGRAIVRTHTQVCRHRKRCIAKRGNTAALCPEQKWLRRRIRESQADKHDRISYHRCLSLPYSKACRIQAIGDSKTISTMHKIGVGSEQESKARRRAQGMRVRVGWEGGQEQDGKRIRESEMRLRA